MKSTNGSVSLRGKAREELTQAFVDASSAEKRLKVLRKMEQLGVEEKDLGFEYEELAKKFHNEGKFPEKVVYYGKKALGILLNEVKNSNVKFKSFSVSLLTASALYLLGSASHKLKRYDESLSYLNWSERNLFKLEEDKSCPGHLILPLLVDVEFALFDVKRDLGRLEEAPVHMRKILEVKQKTLEEGSLKLGEAYKNAYVIYMSAMNMKEAYPFCVKALEIYVKHLGCESVVVGEIRLSLVGIYTDFGEFEKALEQCLLAQSVFEKVGTSYQLRGILIEKGNVLIRLGRYEEAVETLDVVLSYKDLEAASRGSALIFMAKAKCKLTKFNDAKKCMKVGQKIFEELDVNSVDRETREKNSIFVSFGFGELSWLYETMHDVENAIFFSRRVLAIPELPTKLLVDGCQRLSALIFRSGKVEEGIPHLEAVVERLEMKFGPEDSEMGYAYADLGLAYFRSRSAELAAKHLAHAKSVMDVSLGPYHLDSLQTSQALSLAYAVLERFPLAIEGQEKVIEGLKRHGPSVQVMLDKAVSNLNQIMEKKADYECSLTTNSQSDVSEDEMVLKLKEVGLDEEGTSDDEEYSASDSS